MKVTLSLSAAAFLVSAFFSSPLQSAAQDRSGPAEGAATVVACVMREADYTRPAARPTSPSELLLADAESGEPTYVLTGVRETELTSRIGQRVEVIGAVERARTTPLLATVEGNRTGSPKSETPPAAGVTPDGAAAHEPTDALPTTVPAGQVVEPAGKPSDPAYLIATLPRLNIETVRPVPGECASPPRRPAAESAAARETSVPSTPRLPGQPASPRHITARGCLVRQTPEGGTALTPQSDTRDRFALTKAVIVDSERAPGGGVPGSSPSGSGSGTVPEQSRPAGSAGTTATGTLTFALAPVSGNLRLLTSHVGERVEVSGTSAAPRADARNGDTAHPSAPTQVITVTSMRVIGGRCD